MKEKKILITGGAGFIGSHLVRHFIRQYPHYEIYNLDKLTYAGNLENLTDIAAASNYHFIKADIADAAFIDNLFSEKKFDSVIHLAAASHVDRSLENPQEFIDTNITGTVNLLQAALKTWKDTSSKIFYYISTDEVYGSLGSVGVFTEKSPVDPRSPYSASKAAGEHFVQAFHNSHQLPILISRCTNNYGPYHFPEKFIPLIISNIIREKPLPVYGKGEQIRNWLYVQDHVTAIDTLFHKGKTGEIYNIAGDDELKNIDLVHIIGNIMDDKLNRKAGHAAQLITFVKDRPGHDFRYALDTNKLLNTLAWSPSVSLKEGLEKTAEWYLTHSEWLDHVLSGEYQLYYQKNYTNR